MITEKEQIVSLWKTGMPVHEILKQIEDKDKTSAFFRINRAIVEFMRERGTKQEA